MPVTTRLNHCRPVAAAAAAHTYSLRPAPAAGFYAEHADDSIDADMVAAADTLVSMRSSSNNTDVQQLRRSSRLASRN